MLMDKIFKAYDIRGLYPEEIDEEAVYRISLAFLDFLPTLKGPNNRQIVVGYDCRLSSLNLFQAVSQALVSQSYDVLDLGLASTPFFYWALISQQAAGGIMITASHNPPAYNGLKLHGFNAFPLGGNTGLDKIKEIALVERQKPSAIFHGQIKKIDIFDNYIEFLKSKINFQDFRPLKIIIDCGNGVMGPEIEKLFKGLSWEIEILYGEPDGRFPHHEANPSKEENLIDLKRRVKEKKADLGIAFDGDGDRVAFVDEKGESVRGDFITVLIAQEILKLNPGQKIFYEVRSSRIVPESILAAGGVPVLGRAGHTLIKVQMRQEDIIFGGELSGHYFFKELGFVDNPLLALFFILKILDSKKMPFSVLVSPLKKYCHSGEINFSVNDIESVLKKVEEKFSAGQIKKIDGLTVEFPNWWFNLRPSNTEPLVRLNIEAENEELLAEKKKELELLITEK